jgi:uncharacterized membrane protein YsdA (DUF1294 family)/cold shock CspA family protein
MRYQGKISDWKDDKGFGFIMPNGGGKQVFVHIKSFANRQRRPVGSEIVTYELLIDKQGRAKAENVAYVGDPAHTRSSFSQRNFSLGLAIVFLGLIGMFVAAGKLPFSILWLYLTGSAVAFLAYWIDKSAARNDQWRIPEKTLHLFSLIGGWPGAAVAQRALRHKSSKTSFQIAFWTTVILNCSAFAWLLTANSANTLRAFLGMVYSS